MSHKMGIIGYGNVAGYHHDISKRIKDFEVVAAHDIDAERLKAAKEKGLKPYDKLDDFLANANFDTVLVSTPNNFHKPLVVAALDAGKNVICEKPAALNTAEFDEMCAAAKKSGRLFTIHQNRRWDRDFRITKKSVEDGLVGKPYTIESRVQGNNGIIEGWRAYKRSGGGMVFDWGAHLIDQMLWMVKEEVAEVYANLHRVKTPEVEDYFKAVLRFESGLSTQIEFGSYHLTTLPRWYVCGDGGSLTIEGFDCKGKVMCAEKTGAERVRELPLPEVQTDYADYYTNYLAALDGKEELIVKPEEVRRAMRVIDAIFKSHETGETVKLK